MPPDPAIPPGPTMPPNRADFEGASRKRKNRHGEVIATRLPVELHSTNRTGSAAINFETSNGTHRPTYNKESMTFTSTAHFSSQQPYILKPMKFHSGELKGLTVLVLEPAHPPPQRLGFLDLPGEIRNKIYEELLFDEVPYYVKVTGNSQRHLSCSGAPLGLALLATCKQVYHEAGGIYHGLNRFHFTSTTTLFHYLTRIGPAAKFMSVIQIDDIITSTAPKAGKLLAKCSNLNWLRIKPLGREKFTDFLAHPTIFAASALVKCFRPLFIALQERKNNREEVFDTIICRSRAYTCRKCRYGLDPDCHCWSREQWLEDVKTALFKVIQDKQVPEVVVPEVMKEQDVPEVVEVEVLPVPKRCKINNTMENWLKKDGA